MTAAIYGAGTPASAFPAEENTVQAGITLSSANPTASEAFDEPLDMATVLAIASNFSAR
ncbi:hypothetical protein [Hymenobacter volaticus]|uniref:Uncharacterized protein n=1 Tax=Hymenobacter volaticus TaxID=2932254 RepID=A0ABY4GF07_9BACT|nr:hypothetical protein [Hymenobacter volaticus]UOQ69516.1 hypothetical protein MUN86_28150 [Hymenobacter volaticus]